MQAVLASPLGFLVGLSLGALGSGGSIIAIPALVYAGGQDPKAATTTSLVLVGAAALVGLVGHWRARRVRPGIGVAFGACGAGGAIVGSAANRHVDPDVLLLLFSLLVLIAAWRMLVGCPTCTKVGEERALAAERRQAPTGRLAMLTTVNLDVALAVLVAGTAVGFLTGFFGVGGGFVVVPALALLLRLPMPEAIGTSLVVVTINSAVALTTRLATTSIDWAVTLPFGVFAIAGVLVGSHIADRLDPERSLRWFAALLCAVAVYTAIRALTGLA
jgi:uncharacterized membrane protein YfcA